MLEASRQIHKFFYDCIRDSLARIVEKTHARPEELGRDSLSAFLKDIDGIGAQIEGDAKPLRDAYARERAMKIVGKENEVPKAWHLDTREENFRTCRALGRQLLERNHYAILSPWWTGFFFECVVGTARFQQKAPQAFVLLLLTTELTSVLLELFTAWIRRALQPNR
ncbi:hypothetical protein niasHS_014016 [Heterodera schachtii]|uniref:Uncharacterized protein n=1 Tax=Heterodera schachtii TaxID=97005 RepID=A0ABD2IHZ6_HETSC